MRNLKFWPVVFSKQDNTLQNTTTDERENLSVRFLVSGTGTWTTELLGFAATRISNQQSAIVVDQNILNFLFGGLINI